jgi:hypothetical protein
MQLRKFRKSHFNPHGNVQLSFPRSQCDFPNTPGRTVGLSNSCPACPGPPTRAVVSPNEDTGLHGMDGGAAIERESSCSPENSSHDGVTSDSL